MRSRLRQWLETNKIFFETVTATLLSVMAIIVSIVQITISNRQAELTEAQTEIAQRQLAREIELSKTQKTASWGRLHNTMWTIIDQFPPSGTHAIGALPREQKAAWFKRIRSLLDSEIDNPVLIGSRDCPGHWRSAISGAKNAGDILSRTDDPGIEAISVTWANGILKDVLYVWEKLILDSDEVSSTGGRPVEEQ